MLANTNDYPLEAEIFDCIKYIKAKPFSNNFDERADIAEKLYGDNVAFYFTFQDITDTLKPLEEYYNTEIISRVWKVLLQQKRKYSYIFE